MKTHRQRFLATHGLPESSQLSLQQIAKLSKTPVTALQEVYNRGIGAWNTNIASVRIQGSFKKSPNLSQFPRASRLTKEQWAYARVYSFVDGGKTRHTADKDIVTEYGLPSNV